MHELRQTALRQFTYARPFDDITFEQQPPAIAEFVTFCDSGALISRLSSASFILWLCLDHDKPKTDHFIMTLLKEIGLYETQCIVGPLQNKCWLVTYDRKVRDR